MDRATTIAELSEFPPATLTEAVGGVCVLPPEIRQMVPGAWCVGTAFTVRCAATLRNVQSSAMVFTPGVCTRSSAAAGAARAAAGAARAAAGATASASSTLAA